MFKSNSKNITQNKYIGDIQDISKIHIYNEQSNTRITSIAIAKYVTTQNKKGTCIISKKYLH